MKNLIAGKVGQIPGPGTKERPHNTEWEWKPFNSTVRWQKCAITVTDNEM